MKIKAIKTYQAVPLPNNRGSETFFSDKPQDKMTGLKLELVQNIGVKLILQDKSSIIPFANIAFIIPEETETKVAKTSAK